MNRELAIERLNKMRRVCDMEECNINCELCDEALDLAIDALQEPTEEVDYCNNCPYLPWGKDCISRQQAIEVVSDIYVLDDAQLHIRSDCVDLLESLPPVTPTEQTIKEIMDFIGGMNMVDEISNEAYTKISVFVDDGTPTERTEEELDYCNNCPYISWDDDWIPVSERLPEVGEDVLASVHVVYAEHTVIINRYEEQPSWSNGIITAWRPLPEPYKGGDTE